MDTELISAIEVLDTGELLLRLESQGKPIYQYVYREAAGVYWDENRHGFKSTPMKERLCSEWFQQIVSVVKYIGVQLQLGTEISWVNVPEQERSKIERARPI